MEQQIPRKQYNLKQTEPDRIDDDLRPWLTQQQWDVAPSHLGHRTPRWIQGWRFIQLNQLPDKQKEGGYFKQHFKSAGRNRNYSKEGTMKFVALLGLGVFLQSVIATENNRCPRPCEDWDTQCHGDAVRNIVRGETNLVDGFSNSVDGARNDVAGRENRVKGVANGIRGDMNSILGEENKVVGQRNAVKGEYNKVKGTENAVLGKQNSVWGLANKITGELNNVFGEYNAVKGSQNAVKGEQNLVNGVDNWVYGESNKASGESNRIKGATNIVYGSQNSVDGSSNRVGTRCSIPDITIPQYNFKDFKVLPDAPCDLRCDRGGRCSNGRC